MIWKNPITVEELNSMFVQNMVVGLGIRFTEITDDSLSATMPVDERTRQPFGILHGGASVVLAESLGSIASNLVIGLRSDYVGVGLEVNANHIRPVKDGEVIGLCKPIHLGSKTHVWEIKIYDKRGKMNCISRLTVAVVPKG